MGHEGGASSSIDIEFFIYRSLHGEITTFLPVLSSDKLQVQWSGFVFAYNDALLTVNSVKEVSIQNHCVRNSTVKIMTVVGLIGEEYNGHDGTAPGSHSNTAFSP